MDKLEIASRRAEEASRILNSELFTQAFEDIRKGILEQFSQLDRLDDKHVQRINDLHRMLKATERVKRLFEIHIDSGKLAKVEIEGRNKLFSFKR